VDGSPSVDPRDLLVSDAERQHVVGLLNRAVGHGMLTLDEFTERTDTALRARTRGELNAVLIDLPGLTVGSHAVSELRDTLELRQTASSLQRRGRWQVPRRLVLRNRLGSMVLDFSEAHIPHREVTVDVENELGSITVIVPSGSTVDTDGLTVTLSSVTNKVPALGQRGTRHFVFIGRMSGGSITLTPHRSREFGPFVVHRPFRITRRRAR
jgi:hypothetical protein